MKTITHLQLAAAASSDTCHIIAGDHPSFERDIDGFMVRLAHERPLSPLVRVLGGRGGFRFVAVEDGCVIGMVRVNERGEMHIAVAAERRGVGIGTRLGRVALERAIALEYSRVVMRTSGRSRAARRVGEAVGCIVVENAPGRADMIAHLPAGLRSA